MKERSRVLHFLHGNKFGRIFGSTLWSVGETYNWHYGFGLAAIGMAIGQITYYFGQKYLVGVGELKKISVEKKKGITQKKKLSQVEKDRVKVLLISFLMIIIFWGAF